MGGRTLIMYQKIRTFPVTGTADELDNGIEVTDHIRRKSDEAVIPFDPDNVDYQTYLAWLDAGNAPENFE